MSVHVLKREVAIPLSGVTLKGTLAMPEGATTAVVFAHGSGSGRFSPRNRYVAEELQLAGMATLLFDLLTAAEEEAERFTRHLRFDIELLAERLMGAAQWLSSQGDTASLSLGYFGASTGSAAALLAAARAPDQVRAVVSRGGRPDLVGPELSRVRCPTLLIVGGADQLVQDLNREALEMITAERALEVVPNATHLFEEEGALEQVAELAKRWFVMHLMGVAPEQPGAAHP